MADHSSVGNHLADLYNDINKYQQQLNEATENLKEAKVKFSRYLKEAGIDALVTPTPNKRSPKSTKKATSNAEVDADAPYGRKADGTPKKRPGRAKAEA